MGFHSRPGYRLSLFKNWNLRLAPLIAILISLGCAAGVKIIERSERPLVGYTFLTVRPLINASGDSLSENLCFTLIRDVVFRVRRVAGVFDVRVDPHVYTTINTIASMDVDTAFDIDSDGQRGGAELQLVILDFESENILEEGLSLGFSGSGRLKLQMGIIDAADGALLSRGESDYKIGAGYQVGVTHSNYGLTRAGHSEAEIIAPVSKGVAGFVKKEFFGKLH